METGVNPPLARVQFASHTNFNALKKRPSFHVFQVSLIVSFAQKDGVLMTNARIPAQKYVATVLRERTQVLFLLL